jgi:4-aminobutyrate aminotransferase
MKSPHIKTALPGPKAEAMLKRDAQVVSPSYPRDYPFVISHAKGAEAWDVDGNRFLDFMAGIAVAGTGHSHPKVVQAITEAAQKFVHISSDYWHENQIALGEKIAALKPFGNEPAMSFFCQSGTEAVEAAIKLARNVSGRGRYIAFLGGFHGRTLGSLSFTSSKYTQQKGFFPTMPGVTHVPYPNPYRPLLAGSDQGAAVLNYIEKVLFVSNVPSTEVAAILIEPLQGEGGYLVPPDGFLKGLRELCDRHGILLIFDEVQSGVGRTGKMFAAEHSGVVPDIMTLAKGLGSGLPIGMAVAKRSLMERWQRGSHGNTYGGNPVCCAAALATLDLVSSEYCANAARVGEYFIGKLRELQNKYACIGEVRGKGLMLGMELVEDRTTKVPAAKLTEKFIRQAYQNGLLLLSCGQSTIRFMPPLMITREHVDEAITILDATFAETQTA